MNERPDPLEFLRAARPPELSSNRPVDLAADATAAAIFERVLRTGKTRTRRRRRRHLTTGVLIAAAVIAGGAVAAVEIRRERPPETTAASCSETPRTRRPNSS